MLSSLEKLLQGATFNILKNGNKLTFRIVGLVKLYDIWMIEDTKQLNFRLDMLILNLKPLQIRTKLIHLSSKRFSSVDIGAFVNLGESPFADLFTKSPVDSASVLSIHLFSQFSDHLLNLCSDIN
jgi:hypothetical protein